MPLEPIEETDLDVKNKFLEKKVEAGTAAEPIQVETVAVPEQASERKEGNDAYAKIVSKIQTPASVTAEVEVSDDAKAASQAMDAESRINNLVDIAMQKGVAHAVKVAKHLNDNYMLDGFHDKLMADEFHDALLKKGLIKEL